MLMPANVMKINCNMI